MEFTVKEITGVQEKGLAEKEQQLLDAQAAEKAAADAAAASAAQQPPQDTGAQDDDLDEGRVLAFIGKRYNKTIPTLDDLVKDREVEDLPEDVSAFARYRKETGRGIQDYIKLQEDIESADPDSLLRKFYAETEKGLDDEDIEFKLEELSYDEDLDDEASVKKAKMAKKREVAKAKEYFTQQKEKYKAPIESSRSPIPDAEREEYEAYKQYMQKSASTQEEQDRKRQWFTKKTEELFSQEFKGFEFDLTDKKIVFSPGSPSELKSAQSSPSNFISKYLDENGMIKDHVGYHKALAVAMNPERFAKFFYEQGKSDATEGVVKGIKNVNMSERQSPQAAPKAGLQIREVNPDNGRGLKIRSKKN